MSGAGVGDSDIPAQTDAAGVDVEKLAELVYRLLQKDVRLGCARGELLPDHSGRVRSAMC